jgi:hypothetical protein
MAAQSGTLWTACKPTGAIYAGDGWFIEDCAQAVAPLTACESLCADFTDREAC